MPEWKVYLAGPDVFLPDPRATFAAKKAICREAGMAGHTPLDTDPPAATDPLAIALEIARRNERLMEACDLLIANMTPFRGASMDVGTAYEMGYMRGLGKPVFGYSNDGRIYLDKVRATTEVRPRPDGTWEDADALMVEHFGLLDNLMLEGAVRTSGAEVCTPDAPVADPLTEVRVFREAVAVAKRVMDGSNRS